MPFRSEKQRRFMWAQHPDIAQRWVDEGAKSKGLPTYTHHGGSTSPERARQYDSHSDSHRNRRRADVMRMKRGKRA